MKRLDDFAVAKVCRYQGNFSRARALPDWISFNTEPGFTVVQETHFSGDGGFI